MSKHNDDFIAAHGEPVYSDKNQCKYFPDGARISDANSSNFAMYHEPPQSAVDRAIFVQQYWKLRKAFADKAFATLRNQLTYSVEGLRQNNGGRVPVPPSMEEVEKLKQLAENCRVANASLADAEKSLAEAEVNVSPVRAAQAALDREHLEKHRAFQDAVRAIHV